LFSTRGIFAFVQIKKKREENLDACLARVSRLRAARATSFDDLNHDFAHH